MVTARVTAVVPRAPEGMLSAPVATLVMPHPLPPPLSRRRTRPLPNPEALALRCHDVAFSFGNGPLPGQDATSPRTRDVVAAPTGPVAPPAFGQTAGPTLSAGGSPLPAGQVAEIRLVSPLPAGATSVTVQPQPGSAVLAIEVRDDSGLHPVPLHCDNVLAGWWQLASDRFGRDCWRRGEAMLRLPPLHGAATVEVTLVEG